MVLTGELTLEMDFGIKRLLAAGANDIIRNFSKDFGLPAVLVVPEMHEKDCVFAVHPAMWAVVATVAHEYLGVVGKLLLIGTKLHRAYARLAHVLLELAALTLLLR